MKKKQGKKQQINTLLLLRSKKNQNKNIGKSMNLYNIECDIIDWLHHSYYAVNPVVKRLYQNWI